MISVVSLVPSVTESLLSWGITPVACTSFCEQPELRHVGGTKNPDIGAIVSLAPDLVVMCDEENRREHAAALIEGGVAVHNCSPRSVEDVAQAMGRLASALGLDPEGSPVGELPALRPLGLRAFVPIWRRPWMTIAADTYGASVLASLGVEVITFGSGTRYPEVSLEAATAERPDMVLAPSEPYAFREPHLAELEAVAPVIPVDGKDLFWWGIRTPAAMHRLHTAISSSHTG